MSKFWRVVAPVVAAGGLVAAGAIPAASASPAVSIITIGATSPHYPGASHGKVDGYALVVFRTSAGGLNTATVSGTVATSNTGDTATLMAKPFGKSAYAAVGAPINLTPVSGSAPYSFSVKPSLATSYQVQVTGADNATSSAVTVYVTEGGKGAISSRCSAGHCTTTWRVFTILPAAAYKFEAGKKWYPYMTISKSPPRYLHLTKSASVSKAHRVNPNEYEVTLTFHYSAPSPKYLWASACTKDTESKDGLGLPVHEGCGNPRVSSRSTYLG